MAETILLTYGAMPVPGSFDFGKPMYGADMASAAGLVHISGRAGLALCNATRRIYGTTDRTVRNARGGGQRLWAQKNPGAIFQKPLTMARLPCGALHGRAVAQVRRPP